MTEAPPIPPPDGKDWTWSIHRSCPECGYDPAQVQRADVGRLIREYARDIGAALARTGATTRPEPTTWSPLEYACHVRDVCTLFTDRLQLMLTEDDPLFDNWDQDATAIADRYWAQQPATVARQLETQADTAASAFDALGPDQWHRPGRRSNGSVFTVDTFARYLLHDLAHHVADAGM
jgi:DinB family protein